MISSYAWHGFAEDALQLFGLMVRWGVRPTEFSFSCALNSASLLFPVEQGRQIHSLVLKSGWESEVVVASSLMDMYTKFGLIEYVTKIFSEVGVKDLISWNTLIMGLACNGRNSEALDSFKEMLEEGPAPDQLTLAGVLTACSYGGLVDEGMALFSSMEKNYGVRPTDDHYDPVIGMLSQAGKLKEAIEVIETKGYEPSASVWVWMLNACGIHGDLVVAERVAERLLQLDPQSCLPYMVLAQMYEMRAKWESLVQVRKLMKERDVKKVIGCSWIGITNRVIVFKADQMIHQGGKDVHLILNLMTWEMKDGGYVCQQHDKLSFEAEEE